MGRKGKKKSSANGGSSSRKAQKQRAHNEQPPVPAANGEDCITDDDLKGMKCWIKSLTFEKLMESLEFSFHRDGDQGTEVVETFASQDFDLLTKITTIQCKKSKLYGSSSGDGHNSNGIYCGCDERRHHKQLENLCLFRLVDPEMERKTNSTNLTPCKSTPKTKPLHEDNTLPELTQLATDLPAELMDILTKAGVKRSTSDLLETFNEVDELDKAFEPPDEDEDNATFIQYQVEIHEGIADDGTMLGQGSTSEQQTADGALLLWTVLFSDPNSLSNDSNSDISSSSHPPRCKLYSGQFLSKSSDQKMALLDMLRVTSRGNFLSTKGKKSQSYWAPWFEPTQRWFSLPMYLASRYESALWDAYFNRTTIAEANVPKANSLLQSVENLGEESVGRVLSYAFGEAVKKEMIQTSLLQESGSFAMSMVLENLLKNLLNHENDCDQELSMRKRLEYLSVSPLLQWGTPIVELKVLVTKFISHGLSHEAEKSLMQSLSAEDNETKTKKNRKTIRKKRLSHHQPEILSTLEEEQSEEEQESDEDPFVESILPHTSVGATTESNTCEVNSSSNNRGTFEKIIVLQVIDDILTTVFQRLGMEEDTNNDFTDAVLVKSRSDSCQMEDTRNGDDIEAATTAVVSNKASASVDAAMKFLRLKGVDSPSHSHSPKRSQQLWASRNRRESFDAHAVQQSGLKRCLSSGAQAEDAEPIPPQYTHQPNRRHNRSSSLGYSTSIEEGLTDLLEREREFAARIENSSVNPVSSTSASIASSDLNDPGLDIDDYHIPTKITQRSAGLPPTTPLAPTQPSSTGLSPGIGKLRVDTKAAMRSSMTASLSRDDLRSIDETFKLPRRRDDHHTMGHRQVDALLSYRNAVARSSLPRNPASVKSHDGTQKHRDDTVPISARSVKSTKTGIWAPGDFPSLSSSVPSIHSYREPMINKILHLDLACARSESALDVDGAEDASHCNVIPTQNDDTITKDGATTISSVRSTSYVEPDRLASSLKEERNSYRDMCLTLGAENAKLRNLLASKVCAPLYHPPQFSADATPHFQHNILYDHHQRPPSYHQYMSAYNGGANFTAAQSIVAMSDAGLHRGDYDSSAMSEDGTEFHPSLVGNSISWQPRGDSVQSFSRRTSIGGTYADSDASFEHNPGGPGFHRIHYQDSFFGPIPLHGMQSRLSKDIDRYMQSLKSQLKKNEPRRTFAVNQITKAVNALWPRAQIKMYGSHVTKLCLPSSDMDFVICLPAVHKNAPATTPGDLEGRNAINETNQKILARKLKGENWLGKSCKC